MNFYYVSTRRPTSDDLRSLLARASCPASSTTFTLRFSAFNDDRNLLPHRFLHMVLVYVKIKNRQNFFVAVNQGLDGRGSKTSHRTTPNMPRSLICDLRAGANHGLEHISGLISAVNFSKLASMNSLKIRVLGILRKLFLSDQVQLLHVDAKLCKMFHEQVIFTFWQFYATPHDLG